MAISYNIALSALGVRDTRPFLFCLLASFLSHSLSLNHILSCLTRPRSLSRYLTRVGFPNHDTTTTTHIHHHHSLSLSLSFSQKEFSHPVRRPAFVQHQHWHLRVSHRIASSPRLAFLPLSLIAPPIKHLSLLSSHPVVSWYTGQAVGNVRELSCLPIHLHPALEQDAIDMIIS